MAGVIQYVLQDPPPGRGGTFFTGLPLRDGSAKPSYAAWRMSLTAFRRSTGLEVWGAYRRSPRPSSVTLVGLANDGSVAYQRTVSLDPSRYPNGYFKAILSDAPRRQLAGRPVRAA